MKMPKIYLAIDNSFASKRWVQPREWFGLVADMGLAKVEASSDTELDPLYATLDYIRDWKRDVKAVSSETGVEVVNLYSGHGTYATLGLGHPDQRLRDHMKENWVKPMVEIAADLGAGVGFYCHGFSHTTMQDPSSFRLARSRLVDSFSEIASLGKERGLRHVSVEQMYAPHQIPWTIRGTKELLNDVYRRSGAPMYVTIDTGHNVGQRMFGRPALSELRNALAGQSDAEALDLWLGSDAARHHFMRALGGKDTVERERTLSVLVENMDAHPYLFAEATDADPYAWLSALGAYSPIVHLQQVTRNASAHEPFTANLNAKGVIDPGKVLRAIASSFKSIPDVTLPPACDSVWLTLEIFASPAVSPVKCLQQLAESVRYWRRWIPEDGKRIDALLQSCPQEEPEARLQPASTGVKNGGRG